MIMAMTSFVYLLDPTPTEKRGRIEMLMEFLSVPVFLGIESPIFDIPILLWGET